MRIRVSHRRTLTAATLTEVIISTSVIAVLMSSLFLGISMLRRSFEASREFVKSQLEQSRLIDYVSRDLRRALEVTVDAGPDGSPRLNIKIPDFYEELSAPATPRPWTPAVNGTVVKYNGDTSQLVRYYKRTDPFDGVVKLFRSVDGVEERYPIARDVEDFEPNFEIEDNVVLLTVSFKPRFIDLKENQERHRAATTATTRVLLRNLHRQLRPAST